MPRLYQYKLSPEQELELVRRFSEGEKKIHLGKAFGITSNTVALTLRRHGVEMQKRHVHSIYKPKAGPKPKAKPSAALPIAAGLFQSDDAARRRLMAGR